METHRGLRLAESLRTELEEILNYELDDPRATGAIVTEVLVSPDKKKALVRLSLEGNAEEQEAGMEAIQNARAYVRHVVAERLDIYRAPDITFAADLAAPLRVKAAKVLRKMRKGRSKE
jgi:ribosome-binding factor A